MRATRRHPGAAVAAGWLAGAAVEELQQGLRALCRRPEALWGVCVCRARVLGGAGVLAECLWGRATFTFLDPSLGLKSQQSASGRPRARCALERSFGAGMEHTRYGVNTRVFPRKTLNNTDVQTRRQRHAPARARCARIRDVTAEAVGGDAERRACGPALGPLGSGGGWGGSRPGGSAMNRLHRGPRPQNGRGTRAGGRSAGHIWEATECSRRARASLEARRVRVVIALLVRPAHEVHGAVLRVRAVAQEAQNLVLLVTP